MAADRHHVIGLAEALVETLEKLPAKERHKGVSPRIAEELNRLLALAKEVEPNHDAREWLRPIQISDAGMGVTQVFATHAEIEVAARQILKLVPEFMFGTT